MTHPASSSMRRDLFSAYLAAGAKVGSWAIVSALVYRWINPAHFAMLALVRGTIGLLNCTSLGLASAMVRMLAEAKHTPPAEHPAEASPPASIRVLYSNGTAIAILSLIVGLLIITPYALWFPKFHQVFSRSLAEQMPRVVVMMGLGLLLRLASDPAGAVLQTHGRISHDNYLIATSELAWVLLSLLCLSGRDFDLAGVSYAYVLSGLILLISRRAAVQYVASPLQLDWKLVSVQVFWPMLSFGALMVLAQLADFLFAPVNYILINRFLSEWTVATYAPAVQIDGGLLLLVSGLGNVLLPKAALNHTSGNWPTLRRHYLLGTTLSAAILLTASVAVWVASPWLFTWWLGNPMEATQAILPLVLIHTIIGGSSGVGRSILLGMGKVRPFAISAILAGLANVILGFVFVKYLKLGLNGIVYGTILAVTIRCGIWMPWYVLRSLRSPIPLPTPSQLAPLNAP
ncbi:MAG: lipopolysaccharide biosynthesis protein [Bacillota bacterium]